jgi:hypothetical protein
MKEKDIFKRDKYQERKEEPQKEPKCGQGGINPPNLRRPLTFGSEVTLTD